MLHDSGFDPVGMHDRHGNLSLLLIGALVYATRSAGRHRRVAHVGPA